MPLLVDTGILYALADRRDRWHRACVTFVASERDRLLVPVTVLPEVTYLLHTRLGAAAERAFIASIVAKELEVENLKEADTSRAAELLAQHPDIGFVDATILAIAERLRTSRLATTDRRHFSRIVPRHAPALELLPNEAPR